MLMLITKIVATAIAGLAFFTLSAHLFSGSHAAASKPPHDDRETR